MKLNAFLIEKDVMEITDVNFKEILEETKKIINFWSNKISLLEEISNPESPRIEKLKKEAIDLKREVNKFMGASDGMDTEIFFLNKSIVRDELTDEMLPRDAALKKRREYYEKAKLLMKEMKLKYLELLQARKENS